MSSYLKRSQRHVRSETSGTGSRTAPKPAKDGEKLASAHLLKGTVMPRPTESSRWRDMQDGAPDAAHGPGQQSQAGGWTRRMELLMQHMDRANRVKQVDGHAGWSF
ncbi:hypothetical protein CgunFtcFv8_004867 [Champsocephalus gunnari]|uniref:Uncharacterized protein n=1 Tax=Champsocephalus gunnari TaxID=52237 RepID=A0AAN8E180_CHAGU|nr:hypothetical protein CgunFtcFv8_004867 [Champsocephalus gunnari]